MVGFGCVSVCQCATFTAYLHNKYNRMLCVYLHILTQWTVGKATIWVREADGGGYQVRIDNVRRCQYTLTKCMTATHLIRSDL